MKLPIYLSLALFCLFSCSTSSHISKIGKSPIDQFPGKAYAKVYFFQHHTVDKAVNLSYSDDMKLVTNLWDPETMAGMNFSELESGEWNLKKELSKKEIRKLRKTFTDQGREYVMNSCVKSGFSSSLIFVSANQEVVGSIYFCSDGYAIESRPTLRPGKGKSFFWSKEGVEDFKKFLEGLD